MAKNTISKRQTVNREKISATDNTQLIEKELLKIEGKKLQKFYRTGKSHKQIIHQKKI